MKRIICLITALCLILGSFSFCFATDISWNTTDSGHLTEIRNSLMSGGTIYNLINACNTNLNNINYNLVTLMGWLDPSNGGGTTALLNRILNALVYTDAGGTVQSWLYSIDDHGYNTVYYLNSLNSALRTDAMNNMSFTIGPNGTYTGDPVQQYNFVTSVIHGFNTLRIQMAQTYGQTFSYQGAQYNTNQTYTRWDNLNTSTFMPASIADGEYKWLSMIQAPTARLAYVLASNERIAAQEAAADNEEAVVDNFIDSTGSGAASTSDIGSISDLSSGYKSNFGSDASVTGIFNIFNSNNMGWFSNETFAQLDTTSNNNRATSNTIPNTPLLDQKISDIYEAIGLNNDR